MRRVDMLLLFSCIFLFLIALAWGCNNDLGLDPVETDDSFFEATVSGDLSGNYIGSAIFGLFHDPETNSPAILFEFISNDPVELRGFGLIGKIDRVPGVDKYEIIEYVTLLNDEDNPLTYMENESFVGLFIPGRNGEHSNLFASDEGYIDITESNDVRLTGDFSFSAYGYTLEDAADTIRVDIEGEFEAIRIEIQF